MAPIEQWSREAVEDYLIDGLRRPTLRLRIPPSSVESERALTTGISASYQLQRTLF